MKNNLRQRRATQRIGTIVSARLVALLLGAFAIAIVVGLMIQNAVQYRQSFTLIEEYFDSFFSVWDLDEIIEEIETQWMEDSILPHGTERFQDNGVLQRFVSANSERLSELSYVDENGVVTYSSNPDMIGYDLHSNDHTAAFLCLLDDEDYYADPLYPNPFKNDPSLDKVYQGFAFSDHRGMLLKGMTEEVWRKRLIESLRDNIGHTRIGVSGYLIVLMEDQQVWASSYTSGIEEESLFERPDLLPQNPGETQETLTDFRGEKCYISAYRTPDFYMVGVYPQEEAHALRKMENYLFIVLFFVIFTLLFIVISIFTRRLILKQVEGIHASLNRIRDGNLSEKVDVGGSLEFVGLSAGINDMVENLTDRIEQEKQQLAAKLENARRIQESAVPHIFPDYASFGIFACMDPAEAVGGDFYDFYLPGHDTLAFAIADVSGTGMPAALYMMRARTLIKTFAEQGIPVEKVVKETNRKLCEDAVEEMSVTAWVGFLDLKSGKVGFVNAGHPRPILIGNDVSYVQEETDRIMGETPDAEYVKQEITLNKGDAIFLYTSGTIGAMDRNGNVYGEEQLLHVVREKAKETEVSVGNACCEAGCMAVMEDVKQFSAGAKRQDDITMMWIRYWGDTK